MTRSLSEGSYLRSSLTRQQSPSSLQITAADAAVAAKPSIAALVRSAMEIWCFMGLLQDDFLEGERADAILVQRRDRRPCSGRGRLNCDEELSCPQAAAATDAHVFHEILCAANWWTSLARSNLR